MFGGGMLPIDPKFRSEFVGLSEFSRRISTDALSGKGKKSELSELESLNKAIGGGGSGESVLGVLQGIRKELSGGIAGFAV